MSIVAEKQVVDTPVHWIKTIDSALLISLITATSYAVAFQYEAGYLSHFGLPTEYVEVNASRLIIAAGATLFCIVTAMLIWSGINTALPRITGLHAAISNRLTYLLTWGAISLLLANEIEGSPVARALIVGFPVMMLLGELLFPLITHRHLKTYHAKLETSVREYMAREQKDPTAALNSVVVRVVSPTGAAFLYAALLLTTFANAAGVHVARLQSDFLIAEIASPCAVVRPLSEGLLCVGFDAKSKVVRDEYRFLKPEDTLLALRAVGPLIKAEPQQVQDGAGSRINPRIVTPPTERRARPPTLK